MRISGSYDMKCSLSHCKPGDLVVYAMERCNLDVAPKLRVNFQGPYLVLDRLGAWTTNCNWMPWTNRKLYTMES